MSLRDLLRSQLLDKFRKVNDKGGVFLVIFDDESKEMLENYGDINDAMNACGARYADKLLKKRQPQPQHDVLYFMKPNAENIKQVNQDFQNQEHPKYRKVHFLFTAPCTPELSSMFRGQIIDPITVTKQEIIVDIYVGEKNVYHFGKPEHNQLFFFSPEKSAYLYERYCISAVEKLKSLFVSLGDYPKIQYMKSSPHPLFLSKMLQTKLDELRDDEYSSYPVS